MATDFTGIALCTGELRKQPKQLRSVLWSWRLTLLEGGPKIEGVHVPFSPSEARIEDC